MLDRLEENMKMLTGKDKPLKKALLEGDTDIFQKRTCRKRREGR